MAESVYYIDQHSASDNRYVPSDSIGFCVAGTRAWFWDGERLLADGYLALLHDLQPPTRGRALTAAVFARPGTPSSKQHVSASQKRRERVVVTEWLVLPGRE
jgi:hypothetical protein